MKIAAVLARGADGKSDTASKGVAQSSRENSQDAPHGEAGGGIV